jgi:HNH endonuclease
VSEAYVPAAIRRQVRERVDGCCEYCLLMEDDAFFPHEPDHIIAVKHGGMSTLENLAWACFDCNRFKGSDIASLDAVSGDLIPLFNPRIHSWYEHFQLAGAQIFPLTPIGRVTTALLKFNLPQRVEVRETLILAGRYPHRTL